MITNLIFPKWPAPYWVKAATTTRKGGFSYPPFDTLNLSQYVGDHFEFVLKNQIFIKKLLGYIHDPFWLNQKHSSSVILANTAADRNADATFTSESQVVCVVLTADCLPLLFCRKTYPCVAAVHAGWRGLSTDIIKNTFAALGCPAEDLLVWLGPAIGPNAFVVGTDVFTLFIKKNPKFRTAFKKLSKVQWLANIYKLAKIQLAALGINNIYGGEHCTYTDSDKFFSFRRDKTTGRMASLIWIE